MLPMTERFTAGIRHYIDTRRLDLVRFAKGQSKDQVAREYLAGHDGGECILFAGVAQEKTRVWRTAQRRDPATGKRYPWLYQEQAMVNYWYFYGFDADFGPFHLADLASQASLGIQPRPVTKRRSPTHQSQHLTQVDSTGEIPAGEGNLCADMYVANGGGNHQFNPCNSNSWRTCRLSA